MDISGFYMTVIRNARQDAIEPNKPRFQFYFADQPQYAVYECRGRIAHMLKGYRRNPTLYILRRHGMHHYSVRTVNGSAIAVIAV